LLFGGPNAYIAGSTIARIESDAVHRFKSDPEQKCDSRKHVRADSTETSRSGKVPVMSLHFRVTRSLLKRCVLVIVYFKHDAADIARMAAQKLSMYYRSMVVPRSAPYPD